MIAVMLPRTLILAVFGVLLIAQDPHSPPPLNPDTPNILRTPDGRNRTEMILKADHESSVKDIETIRKLVDDLKMEMGKNDRHILSVSSLKKLDEIEKLVKKIRGRMKRF